jgi:arsenate reductase-like glutaredoxin family protein
VRGLVRELGAEVEERNYAKTPLTKKEIVAIIDAVGSVADVVNTRHAVAKERGWKDKAPSKTVFATAAAEDNNLLRRPIVIAGKRVVVGKDEAALRKLLG